MTQPLVLMYHGIARVPMHQDPDNIFVPQESFTHQLERLLLRHDMVPLTQEQYLAAVVDDAPVPARSFLLTFDDGYVSTLETAAPILQRMSIPAVCYVSSRMLGRPASPGEPDAAERLGASGVRHLIDFGVEVGSHSAEHDSLVGMSDAALLQNTHTAREELAAVLGHEPRTFAFPFGHHDAAARAAVARAGYEAAFATYDGQGRFALPRIDINATDTPRSFDLKLSRCYPAVRRGLGKFPRLRKVTHRAVGYAPREAR